MRLMVPGTPQGLRPDKVVARGGKVYRYPAPDSAAYLARIRACWRASGLEPAPAGIPLSLSVTACFPIPPSTRPGLRARMRAGLHLPMRRPGADSLAALVSGALAGLAYPDPRQVLRLEVCKRYAPGPACLAVELEPLEPPTGPDREEGRHGAPQC